jgi:peptide chain release factor 2
MRDFSEDLGDVARRVADAHKYLRIDEARTRLAELEEQASAPDLWDDADRARQVTSEMSSVREDVELMTELDRRLSDVQTLYELAREEDDDSFESEIAENVTRLARDLDRLELRALFSGEHDERDAICEVHSGAGGTDAQDWADMLLRMYLRWADKRGYEANVLDIMPGEEAGIKSATIEIKGKNAYGYLRSERGVHRLVRISPYDSSHARHTSFALTEVMPEVESEAEVNINPDDLRIDVFRASGHGGQNVQKNSTAVRITHIPSGIVVVCQNERSQGRNRESALKVLEARLLEKELAKQAEEQAKIKGEHVSAGWGNQIRSYVLHPYKMVKDLRTGYETSDAEAVLDGDLDGLLRAYQKATIGD